MCGEMPPFCIHEATFFFFLMYAFIYFGAVMALGCCAGFSPVVEGGGCSSLQCEGFSQQWLLLL